MKQYQILNIIGQGAFGNAYLARHLTQDKNYVIKKIELTNKNQQQTENIFNQVKLLQEFKHVNIVSYRQSIIEGQELNIIMQFCYGGDLNQLITEQKQNHGGQKLSESKIIDMATQIGLAIFYMHDKRILHRDLKTPNIFIVDDKVKLGDFGISKVLDQKIDLASTNIGTPYYMSPQQYRHKPYSYKSDMWAFGCILYEMCNQKRPFQAYSIHGLAVKVLQANFAPVSEFYSKELRDLIKSMLQKKQKDRPLIHDFLKTPVIKRRVITYLRETHDKLVKQNGDKVLIQGVIYQAKKLGIQLTDKKEPESAQKKVKPQFSAQKKKQQKQRIRQQLQEQLRKLSEKDKQQKEELRKLRQQKKVKREVDRSQLSNRKSHSNSTKSLKEQTSTGSDSKRSSVQSVKNVAQKQKPFEIKQKYDMYDMEFQEQQDSEEEHPVEAIDEVEQQQQKNQVAQKQHKTEQKHYDKQRYAKPNVKQNIRVHSAKEKFTHLTPVQNQVPIEQAIVNLKQSMKINKQQLNTIKNQLSNIDFSISDSEDQFQKTIEKQEDLPKMKKKEKNPAHVAISDKINDLRLTLQSLLSNESIEGLIKLAQSKGQQANRAEIEKIVGNQRGTYYIAKEVVKLNFLLDRIPLYV